jgi:hypothetical protein
LDEGFQGPDGEVSIGGRGGTVPERVARYVFLLAGVSIVLAWLGFYLIDLRNLFGLRETLLAIPSEAFFFDAEPFFFQHWFRNRGPAEVMQWLCLGGAALTAAFIAGRTFVHPGDPEAASGRRSEFAFWGLIAIALLLMLIEDAGDPRHTLRSYVRVAFGEEDGGVFGTLSELLYFGVLASIPLYAVARYHHVVKANLRGRRYLILAFVSYAVAVSLSFAGTAFSALIGTNLYGEAGRVLYRISLILGDDELGAFWSAWNAEEGWNFVRFYLMDSLVEESIELLGAAAFLSATVSYLSSVLPNSE